MPGEITYQDSGAQTGLTLYAVVRQPPNKVALGAVLETYDAAHWTSYAIALANRGAGFYDADFPALPAGLYTVEARSQLGGAPAVTDPLRGVGGMQWNGAAEVGAVLSAADVWSYGSRSLTQSAAQVAALLTGADLSLLRGDTWSIALTGLGSLTGWQEIWFTVKRNRADTDAQAKVLIKATAGLVTLNGAAGVAGLGSLTVNDLAAGNITIALAAAASALLAAKGGYFYDVQILTAAGVKTLTEERLAVLADITKAVA